MSYNSYKEAVAAALAGREDGFSWLYEKTSREKYYIAIKYMKDPTDAADVLQDAYMKAWTSLGTLEDPERFPGWIGQIVANTALMALRKKQPLSFSDMSEENDDGEEFVYDIEDESIERQPELSYTTNERQEIIRSMIDSLSDEQRLCVMMFYVEEMSVKEIAETIGCSENTVKSRLNYGRKNIKQEADELKKKGYNFYGLAPLPLLLALLHTEKAAAMGIAGAVGATAAAAGTAATSATVAGVAGGMATTGAQIAAGTAAGAASTAASSAVFGKLVAGIAIALTLGAAGFGTYKVIDYVSERDAAVTEGVSGSESDDTAANSVTTQSATVESTATPAPTPTVTPTPTPKPEYGDVLTKAQCRALCEELEKGDPVKTKNEHGLKELCFLVGGWGNTKPSVRSEVLFRDMNSKELVGIQDHCLQKYYGHKRYISPAKEKNYKQYFDVKKALKLWNKIFDRNMDDPVYNSYHNKNWKLITKVVRKLYYLEMPEPDEWDEFTLGNIYENDSFYLVVGMTNHATDTEDGTGYQGRCCYLIRKNKWKLPGTVIYCRSGADVISLHKRNISASSTLSSMHGNSYQPWKMIDGNKRTAWSEGRHGRGKRGKGVGVTITIRLDKSKRVHGIAFMNGYQKSRKLFENNGRLKKIRITTDKGNAGEYRVGPLSDEPYMWYDLGGYSYVELKKPVSTKKLKIKILDAVRVKHCDDTCVSEIRVY